MTTDPALIDRGELLGPRFACECGTVTPYPPDGGSLDHCPRCDRNIECDDEDCQRCAVWFCRQCHERVAEKGDEVCARCKEWIGPGIRLAVDLSDGR